MEEPKQQELNKQNECCNKIRKFGWFLWKNIKSWRFFYLLLFFIGQLLSIFFTNPTNIASFYTPLFLMVMSFIIKMVLMRKRINCKIFWRMQLDFASPYVLTVINMVLLLESYFAMDSYYQFNQIIPDLVSYAIVNSLLLFLGTLICSLVMNRRTTTKMEYYMILVNISMQAISNLYLTITTILLINQFIDQLREDNEQLLLKVISGQLDPNDYQVYYNIFSESISALQTSKDFSLACIASIISVLVILIDFIARPLQKLQHQQQIYKGFIKNCNLPFKVNRDKKRNRVTLHHIPQLYLNFPTEINQNLVQQTQLKNILQTPTKINTRKSL